MSALTVGLTGGVASGKSLVADAFTALGAPLIDGDQVARDIVALGMPALAEIREAFGAEFLLADGQLDRRKLRERVFSQPAERTRLERITHPHIRAALRRWRDAQTSPYCILSVAILIESGMDALVDRILVVDAPESVQLQRLQARDGISESLARGMLAAQATRAQRLARADDVLRNENEAAVLTATVKRLHEFYLELAKTGQRKAPGLHLP